MTKQEKSNFLKELKAYINENTEFSCTYPIDENIGDELFIWIKTKDAKIGNLACHYEVLFYSPCEGVSPNKPFVEVHFENKKTFKAFQGIELPEWLTYGDWDYGRIVYMDDGDSRLSNVAIIERLRKLDKRIGKNLRAAFDSQIPKAGTKSPTATENAKAYASYKCELCVTPTTQNCLEAHHLIPTAKQADFDYSLDQEQNLVCLCPNCHTKIHFGMDKLDLVEELWKQRKTKLKAAGIGINLTDLKAYYP